MIFFECCKPFVKIIYSSLPFTCLRSTLTPFFYCEAKAALPSPAAAAATDYVVVFSSQFKDTTDSNVMPWAGKVITDVYFINFIPPNQPLFVLMTTCNIPTTILLLHHHHLIRHFCRIWSRILMIFFIHTKTYHHRLLSLSLTFFCYVIRFQMRNCPF